MDSMDSELKQAKSMADILAIAAKYYNLTQPLGIATKSLVTMGVAQVLQTIKAPEIKK